MDEIAPSAAAAATARPVQKVLIWSLYSGEYDVEECNSPTRTGSWGSSVSIQE